MSFIKGSINLEAKVRRGGFIRAKVFGENFSGINNDTTKHFINIDKNLLCLNDEIKNNKNFKALEISGLIVKN